MQRWRIGHLSVPSSEAYPTHCSGWQQWQHVLRLPGWENVHLHRGRNRWSRSVAWPEIPQPEILFKSWHAWSGRTSPGFKAALLLFGTLVPVLARQELTKPVMGTVTWICSNLQTSNKFQAEPQINSYSFQIASLIPPGYSWSNHKNAEQILTTYFLISPLGKLSWQRLTFFSSFFFFKTRSIASAKCKDAKYDQAVDGTIHLCQSSSC